MLDGATLFDILMMAFLLFGMGSIAVFGAVFVFHRFVALNSVPDSRALWTAGLAYLAAVTILGFSWSGALELELLAPVVPLPAAIVAYLYLRKNYRALWVDDPSELPDGVGLANSNWRLGLLFLLGGVAIVVIRKLPVIMAVQAGAH